MQKTQESFLYFWKRGIDLLGTAAFDIKNSDYQLTPYLAELRLNSEERVSMVMSVTSSGKRILLGIMASLINPDWGSSLCEEYGINFHSVSGLDGEFKEVAIGLLLTFTYQDWG